MAATMQDWKFFATVCDVGANNAKALELLNVSEKTPFFRFQNWEIAAIFAHPCLLKFTCSVSQKHDVANVECEITVNGEKLPDSARVDDVLKLNEVARHIVCCLQPEVTERHIKPGV